MTHPAYVSRATLAELLDCSGSTVDVLVKQGVLPPPMRLTPGTVRWRWEDVDRALASLGEMRHADGAGLSPDSSGFTREQKEGIDRVLQKAKERRRGRAA